jgi:hypothetical protein
MPGIVDGWTDLVAVTFSEGAVDFIEAAPGVVVAVARTD